MQSRIQQAPAAAAPSAGGAQWGASLGPRSAAEAVRGYPLVAAAAAAAAPAAAAAAAAHWESTPAWGQSRQQAGADGILDAPVPRCASRGPAILSPRVLGVLGFFVLILNL